MARHRSRKQARRYPEARIDCIDEGDTVGIYVVFGGVRIAKRGAPDSPQARIWISLEPGFEVFDKNGDAGDIVIRQHQMVSVQ
jgi:hypothetical protein